MSRPRYRTVPEVGSSAPVITLKSVVLPQPLGPMMQRSSPGSSSRASPESAFTPPNVLTRSRTSRSGGPLTLLLGALARGLDGADVLFQDELAVMGLGDEHVEVDVTVLGPQRHLAIARHQRLAGHSVGDLLLVVGAGTLDALDEEAGQVVVRIDGVGDDCILA